MPWYFPFISFYLGLRFMIKVFKHYPIIPILITALALRLAFIGAAPLWYDEAFTAWVSAIPFADMWAALLGDVHPPLYYSLTWGLVHLTGADTPERLALALRLLSVPFSLWAVYLTYQIGQALYWPKRATLAAAAFMAVSPAQIFFAQEARMYAIFQAVVLLAFLGLLKRQWWLATLSLALALWLHNYGLIYWGALGLVVLFDYVKAYRTLGMLYHPRIIFSHAAAFTIPLILWLPWVAVLARQMGTVAGGYWILPPTVGDILSSFYYILGGITQRPEFHAVAVMVCFGAAILTVYRVIQKRPPGWVPLAVFGFTPLAVAVIGSYLWQPVLLYRGLLPSSAALALLIGWALTRGPVKYQAIAAALIVPVVLAALCNHYTANPKDSNQEVAYLIERIRAEWQPGDIIYHVDAGSMVGFWLYARDLPQYLAPPCEDETLGSLSAETRRGLGIIEKPLDEIDHGRAWVAYTIGPTARACMVRDYGYLAEGEAWEMSEDSECVFSGVWLHE